MNQVEYGGRVLGVYFATTEIERARKRIVTLAQRNWRRAPLA
jgi:hypothetical protein